MAEPVSVAGTEAQTKRFADAADSIRTRADSTAKGLAAVGTTAVGALGVVKFPATARAAPDGLEYRTPSTSMPPSGRTVAMRPARR